MEIHLEKDTKNFMAKLRVLLQYWLFVIVDLSLLNHRFMLAEAEREIRTMGSCKTQPLSSSSYRYFTPPLPHKHVAMKIFWSKDEKIHSSSSVFLFSNLDMENHLEMGSDSNNAI